MGKKEEETRQKAGGVEGHFLLEEGHSFLIHLFILRLKILAFELFQTQSAKSNI